MATQTSYSRTLQEHQVVAMRNKLSVVAQAKPAIISQDEQRQQQQQQQYDTLSEKINTTLQFNSTPSMSHIEDETLLEKQNATNHMRQAAIASAAANLQQQSKRLSATERLALSAKRPQQQQQVAPPLPLHQRTQSQIITRSQPAPVNQQARHLATSSVSSSKLAPMPTLETLLAVQRQLQRHTRQNLTSSTGEQQESTSKPSAAKCDDKLATSTNNTRDDKTSHQHQQQFPNLTKLAQCQREQNNPYVTSAVCQQGSAQHAVTTATTNVETYEKELPPLPESVSPSSYGASSSSGDDSQLNSLESQSSPATSLVSLPPPPPPLSAYLEQYDEVSSSLHSSSSRSPSSTSSHSISSGDPIKQQQQFAQVPIKLQSPRQLKAGQANISSQNNHFVTPLVKQQQQPPPLAPRPQHMMKTIATGHMEANENGYKQRHTTSSNPHLPNGYSTPVNGSSSSCFMPPPPPPPPPLTETGFDEPDCAPQSFRFPTPPPPELLSMFEEEDDEDLAMKRRMAAQDQQQQVGIGKESLDDSGDDSDDDDDFQCRIPTPPPSQKSVSFASFQDLNLAASQVVANQATSSQSSQFSMAAQMLANQHQQFNFKPPVSVSQFNPIPNFSNMASSASTSFAHHVQPPPLFRQTQTANQQPPPTTSTAPQLTVRVQSSDDEQQLAPTPSVLAGGLLSTTANQQQQRQQQQTASVNHLVLAAMVAASSSSPSSSSDGDNHSSNSSSSTSGVHSSIDSPLSDKNCKLARGDTRSFNYVQAKLASRKLSSSSSGITYANPTTTLIRRKPAHIQQTNAAPNLKDYLIQQRQQQQAIQMPAPPPPPPPQLPQLGLLNGRRNSNSSLNSIGSTATATSNNGSVTSMVRQAVKMPARPALKQKKSVHFSDKIEMVACAEEQCEAHLPNPLLARVLAGKQAR